MSCYNCDKLIAVIVLCPDLTYDLICFLNNRYLAYNGTFLAMVSSMPAATESLRQASRTFVQGCRVGILNALDFTFNVYIL